MRKIMFYLVLLIFLSVPGYYCCIYYQSLHMPIIVAYFIIMWAPASSAITTKAVFDRSLKGIGWSNNWCFFVLAFIVPIVYSSLAYWVVFFAGYARINASFDINWISIFLVWLPINFACALGEEIGWRGFLVPELFSRMSYARVSLVVGAIWALWHFPVMIAGHYLESTPLVGRLTLFFIMIIAVSFIFTWFRLRSGSIWVVTMLHAGHNDIIQELYDPLIVGSKPISKYLLGEAGAATVVAVIIMALIICRGKVSSRVIRQL